MTDAKIYNAGDFVLQSGLTLPDAKIAYVTYGELNAAKDNVIVYPTRYAGTHNEQPPLIGEGMALDPAKYFIIVPNTLGNGASSSPSAATAPIARLLSGSKSSSKDSLSPPRLSSRGSSSMLLM